MGSSQHIIIANQNHINTYVGQHLVSKLMLFQRPCAKKYQTGKSLKLANRLSSDFFLLSVTLSHIPIKDLEVSFQIN